MSRSSCSVGGVDRARPARAGRLVGDARSEQPVDGGAHGGQRGAQVVRDRAQQRGRGGLGALEGGGPLVALAQPAVLQHQPGLHGERLEHPLVGGPQRLAAQREHVRRRRPGPGCRPRRASAAHGRAGRGQHRPARRAAREQRDGVLAEGLAEPLDDRLGGVLAGQHRAGQRAQRGRLGAGAERPRRRGARPGPPRSRPPPRRRRRRAARARCAGSETVSVPIGGVKKQLSGEEPDDRAPTARAAARRPGRPATVEASRGAWPAGAGRCRCEAVQHPGEQDRQHHAPSASRRPGGARTSGERTSGGRAARRATWSWVTRWTSIDAGQRGDPVARRTGEQPAQPAVPGDADDDHRGVGAGREVDHRGRDVLADDRVEGAAERGDQLLGAVDPALVGAAQAVGGDHVHGQQLGAGGALGEPGAAPDQGLALGAAGDRDDDPLLGRPGLLDPVRAPVVVELRRRPGRPATAARARAAR